MASLPILNGQIKKTIAEKASKDYSNATLGASYRGSGNSGNSESVYASLCDVISNYDNIKSTENIKLQKKKKDDDEFYFIVENKSDYPLFVNILQISETLQSPILCFNLGYSCDEPYMLIPPHKQVSVEHFVFANSSEDKNKYILFASEHPFDTQELQTLLNSNVKSTITTKDRLPVYIYSCH